MTVWRTVFDLATAPERIAAPWGFLSIFWCAGLVVAGLAALMWRRGWKRWGSIYFTLFALVWWGGTAWASWNEFALAARARAAARSGRLSVAEGCLSAFHPGSATAQRSIAGDEVWTVNGMTFAYGTGNVRIGYARVEALGGAVHADSRVRVHFLDNAPQRRAEILRLDVQDAACPTAPDPQAR